MKLYKTLGLIVLLLTSILLVSCSNDDEQQNYVLPPQGKMTTVEINHNKGYGMTQVVIDEDTGIDQYELAKRRKQIQEDMDKYETLSAAWEKENLKAEDGVFYEEVYRIEAYCEEHGFLACSKITETCDRDGCYEVTVTCDDDTFDIDDLEWGEFDPSDECDDVDVVIDDNAYEDPYEEKILQRTTIK